MSRHPTPQATRSKPLPRFALRPTAVAVHLLLAGVAIGGWVGTAQAQTAAAASARSYNIPAGPLSSVLTRFLGESGVLLSGSTELAQGKQSPGVQGNLTPDAALAALLAGTGLQAVVDAQGRYVLRPAPVVSRSGEALLATVTVRAGADLPGSLSKPYAGGQVARGGRVGFLGDLDVFETPFSVTHFTNETLQNQQVHNIGDALINDPSVQSRFSRYGAFDQFEVRGFLLFAGDTFFNGLPGIIVGGGASTIPDSFERVDLIKGPNALLSGVAGSTIGGRVNLVPKRASDAQENSVTLGYATSSVMSTHLDVGKRFGQDSAFGIRFNGTKRKGEAADGHDHEADAYALAIDYRGEKFRAAIDLGKQKQSDNGGSDFVLIGASLDRVPSPPRNQSNLYQPWATSDFDSRYYALRAELDISDEWTAHLAVGGRDEDYTRLRPIPQLLNSDGSFQTTPAFGVFPAKSFAYDAGVTGEFKTGSIEHKVHFNVTQFESKSGSRNTSFPPAIQSNFNNPVNTQEPSLTGLTTSIPFSSLVEQPSIGFADIMSFAGGDVQLILGARRQTVKVFSLDAITGAKTNTYDESAITPSVGLIVKPWENISLYSSYIEGLTQGPTAPAGTVNAGEVFPPFASKQIEVGAKADLGSLALTAALFRISQPSALTNPATNRFDLDGEQQNTGLELGVFGEVARGVRLLGGATFLDGELKRTANGTNDGNTAVGTPKLSVSLGSEWDLAAVPGLTLSGRVIHVGSQYVNASNTLSIPSWTRWDVGARYVLKSVGYPVTLRANVENLFDRNYWSSASRGFLSFGAPRTVVVSATFEF